MSDSPPKIPGPKTTMGLQKIAQLVERRDDASMEEIEGIIKNDPTVTGRLMQIAFPRAPAREEATLQMATSRVGINYVIVLYITDVLTQYIVDAFQTEAGVPLTKDDPALTPLSERGGMVATIQLRGKADVKVSLVYSNSMGHLLADQLLPRENEITHEGISQVVEHLSGIIANNLQAGLSAGRLPCTLESLQVAFQENFAVEKSPGSTKEEFYFRYEACGLRVYVSVSAFSLGK